MLAAYLTGALICLAALAAGQAAMALCGRREPSPLAPAVGLSLLLIVANLAIQLPGRATTAAIALGILLIAALVVLGRRAGGGPSKGSLSEAATRAAPLAAAAAAISAVAASIPFLANGRMGPLGQGLVNDDMASHLLFTEWISTKVGETPDLVADGYPLAPHSLVGAVAEATGTSHVEVFGGLTLALAALVALTAYGGLDSLHSAPLRIGAAVLVALPYLAAAWFAQGAFKEPMLALFLVAFALGLREAGRAEAPYIKEAIPLGLIAAGALYAYSFPALAWLGAAAIATGLLSGAGGGFRQAPLGGAAARAAIGVVVGVVLLAALPEAGRLIDFAGFGAFDPEGEGPRVGLGNLDNALTPFEGLNVWPASDFRVDAADASVPAAIFYLGGLLGAAALAWGVAVAVRERESALLGALVAASLGYLGAVAFGTPYTSAKALVIAAPVAMLIALRGLIATDPPRVALLDRLAPLRIPLAVLFIGGAVVSSLLPLRAAAVGPDDHADEIRSLRETIDGRRVLFLGRDQFVAWELIGSKVATPILNYYNQKSVGNRYEPTPVSAKLDFDAVTPELLDFHAYVITTGASYQSVAPPNFELVAETPSYRLWERTGPTPPRETLDEPRGPGAILDCSTPEGRELAARRGTALVTTPPVVGPEAAWQPSPRVTDGHGASQELVLEPGQWAISLQYTASQDLHVTGGGLDQTLPANLDFRGPSPFWPVGEIDVRDPTARIQRQARRLREGGSREIAYAVHVEPKRIRISVSVDDPPLLGRLIGAEAVAFPLAIAATPLNREDFVPLRQACGRYVDFISPG